jgi:hypothetical protein
MNPPGPSGADATPSEPGGYDRQLIVVLPGDTDDAATADQAEALDQKRRETPLPSEVVTVRRGPASDRLADGAGIDELEGALAGRRRVSLPVGRQSRLYLVGVGNAAERTLSGWSPVELAALLAGAGLRELDLISIVGDGAGRDRDRDDDAQTDPAATSFASVLHRVLRDEHGVVTTVNARVGAVRVLTRPTEPGAGAAVITSGRKLTAPRPGDVASEHHAPRSKLHMRWDGDHQVREWSY